MEIVHKARTLRMFLGSRHTFLSSRVKVPHFCWDIPEEFTNAPDITRFPLHFGEQRFIRLSPHFPSSSLQHSLRPQRHALVRRGITDTVQRNPPGLEEVGVVESEGAKEGRWRTDDLAERQKAKIDAQRDEIIRLRNLMEKYAKKYREAKERIVELEHDIGKVSDVHQETLEKQNQRIQSLVDRLAQTEELLATRSAELAGAQYFLSTTDRLSEADVLGIVREVNENIFQVAANLTEEWEKLGSSRSSKFTITQEDLDASPRFYGPVLIRSTLDRNPASVTSLVQSCLCNSCGADHVEMATRPGVSHAGVSLPIFIRLR